MIVTSSLFSQTLRKEDFKVVLDSLSATDSVVSKEKFLKCNKLSANFSWMSVVGSAFYLSGDIAGEKLKIDHRSQCC
jgi:hypothetical protein